MDKDLSPETWHRLREEARKAAAVEQAQAEQWTRAAQSTADWDLLTRLEQRLEQLNQAWAVHEKPLLTRVPLIGPLLARLCARLARFFLQNQVAFNAEMASLLQELYQAQCLLAREQIERGDDLFSRLDERLLALEARLRDLEDEVARLRAPQS